MSLFVIAAAVAVGAGLAALVWLVLGFAASGDRLTQRNLARGLEASDRAQRRRNARGSALSQAAPPKLLSYLDRLLAGAGRPLAWPLERLRAAKLLAAFLGGMLGLVVFLRAQTTQAFLILILFAVFGFVVPDLLLWNSGIKRRQAIAYDLPDTLDQMSIAVDAGLGFDAALVRVARNGKGVLASEFIRTLQDIQVGVPRRVAFEALSGRADVPELRRFIRAVIQAEEYGIALSQVLRVQAEEMRVARRQRAERKAMEIPVKVSFPLVLVILPALMIVVMGPAVIGIMQAFSK